jgi:myo-inositol-1-phosphate synthase
MDKAQELMADIAGFRGASRLVMIWCGPTEVFHRPAAVHQTLASFEEGLCKNDPLLPPARFTRTPRSNAARTVELPGPR